jgi:hypothetical protein
MPHFDNQKCFQPELVLTPVILATWEVGIGKTEIRGQPGQIVQETPSPKITRAKMDWRRGSSGRVPEVLRSNPSPTKRKKKSFQITGFGITSCNPST